MAAGRKRKSPARATAVAAPDNAWQNRISCVVSALVLGVVYLVTLYPGVSRGDSAELQYMCPLLGICHPPGYALEVIVGKLFSILPLGAGVAWRINFMQAFCSVVGCLALFGALRRLLGQILPALVATGTLAFSSIYWSHSVVAEVYVFYGMFLLLGLYATVRFLSSDKTVWLILAALSLGISVGGRLSELLVLPAFAGLWLAHRRQVRLGIGRALAAGAVALVPFAFAVLFYLARQDPALLHARDDALRDEVLNKGLPVSRLPFGDRVREAVLYTVGLKGAGQEDFTAFSWKRLAWDLGKYAWLLSGRGAFGDRFPAESPDDDQDLKLRRREQGRGTSIGALGVVLAIVGLRFWREQRGVVLLGLGLFLGNLVFYVYLHPVDNLHFITPGLIGLALLVGLGVWTRTGGAARRWHRGYQAACLIVPLFLLVTNYRVVDFRTPETREHLELAERVKRTRLPPRTVIVATYSRAHTLRYLYWIDAARTRVRVFIFRERYSFDELLRMVTGLQKRGQIVLFSTEAITAKKTKLALAAGTPRPLVEVGLFWAHPPPQPPPGDQE